MNEQFVKRVYSSIVEGNMQLYSKIFNDPITDETIKYWRLAKELYRDLNNQQQEILYMILRQVIIDTLSTIFGTFDGICGIDDEDWQFTLTINGESTEDDLQDAFLVYIRKLIESGELI